MKIREHTVIAVLCLTAGLAHAAPVSLSTGHVDILFDTENGYSASIERSRHEEGTIKYETTVLPSYTTQSNRLIISANLSDSMVTKDTDLRSMMRFSLHGIHFSAHQGYTITGYRFTFSGFAESYGSVEQAIWGSGEFRWEPTFDHNYVVDSGILTALPSEGFSGFAFMEKSAFGDGVLAGNSIDRISVEAITQPIPEPETYTILGLGLFGIAVARKRAKTF